MNNSSTSNNIADKTAANSGAGDTAFYGVVINKDGEGATGLTQIEEGSLKALIGSKVLTGKVFGEKLQRVISKVTATRRVSETELEIEVEFASPYVQGLHLAGNVHAGDFHVKVGDRSGGIKASGFVERADRNPVEYAKYLSGIAGFEITREQVEKIRGEILGSIPATSCSFGDECLA